jgi:hypothetical protein
MLETGGPTLEYHGTIQPQLVDSFEIQSAVLPDFAEALPRAGLAATKIPSCRRRKTWNKT